MELTDLEICKRLAEIEGATETFITRDKTITALFDRVSAHDRTAYNYNPLTDDALCFQLMVKYKISLIQHQDCTAVYCIWNHDEKHSTETLTNPNKAICLAIIEAHKENV